MPISVRSHEKEGDKEEKKKKKVGWSRNWILWNNYSTIVEELFSNTALRLIAIEFPADRYDLPIPSSFF